MNHNLKEQAPGVWSVYCLSKYVGTVVRGDFIERLNGEVTVTGKHWAVVGYEYARFESRDNAVSALCGMVTIEETRHIKLDELGRCETEMALATNKARRKSFRTTLPGIRKKYRRVRKELVKINRQCVQSLLCMEGPLGKKPSKIVKEADDV